MILETIVKEINRCGVSRYRISQETGINEAVLCRVYNGGSCSIKTADLLCRYLKLELKPKAKGKK